MIDLGLALTTLIKDLDLVDDSFIAVMDTPFVCASVIMEIIKWLPHISYHGFAMYKVYKLMNNHQYAEISSLLKSVGSSLIELARKAITLQKKYNKCVGMDLEDYYWKLVFRIQEIRQPLLNLYYYDIKRLLHLLEILQEQSIRKRSRTAPTIRDCAPSSKRRRTK